VITEAGVEIGDVLAGKYRVERILGVGGMGVVVAAHHLILDEKVAIKFLLPDMLSNQEVVVRFAREAKAAVKIKSEHVARVIDVGSLDTGAPFIVMEYLDGTDLSAWLRDRGAQSIEQAVEFLLQACEAIAEAHALGIVHRDLKPANLFVIRRADGLLSIKVLDFGISKMTVLGASGTDMSMTKTSTSMGSPLYMAPEQMASSRDADRRADIWALGAILYELLSGRVPFSGTTLPEVCFKIATAPPDPLRTSRPDVPASLEAVIHRCLEKDRERRYHNVAELAVGLLPFAPSRARGSIDRISRTIQSAGMSIEMAHPLDRRQGERAPGAGSGTQAAWGSTGEGARRRSSRILILAAIGVGVLATGVFLLRRTLWPPAGEAAPAAAVSPPETPSPPPPGPQVNAMPIPAEPAPVVAPPASPAEPPIAAEPRPTRLPIEPAPWAARPINPPLVRPVRRPDRPAAPLAASPRPPVAAPHVSAAPPSSPSPPVNDLGGRL
jgi:tRNA A-37 threonylcarbamoyl transferase component Bud32